jgi:hypothetical protein
MEHLIYNRREQLNLNDRHYDLSLEGFCSQCFVNNVINKIVSEEKTLADKLFILNYITFYF